MRVMWIVLLLALAPGLASGGSYTITTTAAEDTALQALTNKVNAQRALQTPPARPVTLDFLVTDQLQAVVREWTAR